MSFASEITRKEVGLRGRPVYQLRQVAKSYAHGRLRALDRVNLTLTEGSFSSVIGPSGCGKSTLLKIMAGVVPPTEGSVVLEGKPVTGTRRDIGMMFQQATLFPWRSTLENIVLPIEIRDGKRVPKGNRETKADGSWREVSRQGNCVTVKERSANGEYKETRQCDPK